MFTGVVVVVGGGVVVVEPVSPASPLPEDSGEPLLDFVCPVESVDERVFVL